MQSSKLKSCWICFTGFPDPSRTQLCEEPEESFRIHSVLGVNPKWNPSVPIRRNLPRMSGSLLLGLTSTLRKNVTIWNCLRWMNHSKDFQKPSGHSSDHKANFTQPPLGKCWPLWKPLSTTSTTFEIHYIWLAVLILVGYHHYLMCLFAYKKGERQIFLLKEKVVFTAEKFEEIFCEEKTKLGVKENFTHDPNLLIFGTFPVLFYVFYPIFSCVFYSIFYVYVYTYLYPYIFLA